MLPYLTVDYIRPLDTNHKFIKDTQRPIKDTQTPIEYFLEHGDLEAVENLLQRNELDLSKVLNFLPEEEFATLITSEHFVTYLKKFEIAKLDLHVSQLTELYLQTLDTAAKTAKVSLSLTIFQYNPSLRSLYPNKTCIQNKLNALGQMETLRGLSIQSKDLYGSFQQQFFGPEKGHLQMLELSGTNIAFEEKDDGEDFYHNFTHLNLSITWYLSGRRDENDIRSNVSILKRCRNLVSLTLAIGSLEEEIVLSDVLNRSPDLTHLHLVLTGLNPLDSPELQKALEGHNGLTQLDVVLSTAKRTCVLKGLEKCSSLKKLSITICNVSDQFCSSSILENFIPQNSLIEELSIKFFKNHVEPYFCDHLFEMIAPNKKLKSVEIISNDFRKINAGNVAFETHGLEKINLRGVTISESNIYSLRFIPNLKVLELEVSDDLAQVEHLARTINLLPSLQILTINNLSLQGNHPLFFTYMNNFDLLCKAIASLPHLESLTLNFTEVAILNHQFINKVLPLLGGIVSQTRKLSVLDIEGTFPDFVAKDFLSIVNKNPRIKFLGLYGWVPGPNITWIKFLKEQDLRDDLHVGWYLDKKRKSRDLSQFKNEILCSQNEFNLLDLAAKEVLHLLSLDNFDQNEQIISPMKLPLDHPIHGFFAQYERIKPLLIKYKEVWKGKMPDFDVKELETLLQFARDPHCPKRLQQQIIFLYHMLPK